MHTPSIKPDRSTPTVRSLNAHAAPVTLKHLVGSTQPAVVFTSLAALCVPTFSDQCSIVIEEDDDLTYRIGRTVEHHPPAANAGHFLRTSVRSEPLAGYRQFRGVVVHSWFGGHRPTYADAALAQLMVERAVAAVHQERLGTEPIDTEPIDAPTLTGGPSRVAPPRPTLVGHRVSRPADLARRERRLRYPDCPPRSDQDRDAGSVGAP